MGKKKDSEELEDSELQKKFEEEIKKPYYNVDYFDEFTLPYEKLEVTVVIPTYNRCPYKPNSLKKELNPLAWSLQSALLQKPPVCEIIIVDDKSTDYTEEVVKSFQEEAKEKGVKLTYIKNKNQIGNGASRNIGSKFANTKFLFFTDDDLIMAPYAIFGSYQTFKLLEDSGEKVGMVGLPVYFRKSFPSKYVEKKEIGRLNYMKGIFTTNKDSFIQEYLDEKEQNKKFIDNELNILQPIEIQNANAYALCTKSAFEEVGGFPTRIKRGEDREFGSKLMENGYDIYFTCDVKFQGVHGMFGFDNGVKFEGEDWLRKVGGMISLKKSMDHCDKPQKSTGARVEVEEYLFQQIFSFFYSSYLRNKAGALKWIKKVHQEFVVRGQTSIFGNENMKVPNAEERKSLWISSISRAFTFLKEEEKSALKKINKTIRQLHDEKAPENIFEILEKS